jgi:hypothetical protein
MVTKLQKSITVVCFVGAVLFPVGCRPSNTRYHVILENASTADLCDVTVRFGEFEAGPSSLIAGTSKTRLDVWEYHPYPTNATVRWTPYDGDTFCEEVEIPTPIKASGESYRLLFRFVAPDKLEVVLERAGAGHQQGRGLTIND